ncbi:hypothetical protein MNBD_PLANCTO02-1315 [hydrothermal vent metagenome]|uniref:AB hydrolase-1 domain-containing protein n=1 Tax=hydrothermal vent metagenome TaxID=652676 RepID=A0A3B1E025_9ZZZZ
MLLFQKQKRSLFFLLITALLIATSTNVNAQEGTKKRLVKTVKEMSVTTDDGWQIAMTYYQSNVGKEAPVVILLHGKNGNRLIWNVSFAKELHRQGYAVVTVDLRKHGESTPRNGRKSSTRKNGNSSNNFGKIKKSDYKKMVLFDLEAVKKFLRQEHEEQRLNLKKIGIVGADMSTVIALNFAARDWLKKPYDDAPTLATRTPRGQDVRAIVLLSPLRSIPGLSSRKSVSLLRKPFFEIAFLTCVGEKDTESYKDALKIQKQLNYSSKNKGRIYQKIYSGRKFRGTDLLGDKLAIDKKFKPQTLMLAFFNKHLKNLGPPWSSRKNKINN